MLLPSTDRRQEDWGSAVVDMDAWERGMLAELDEFQQHARKRRDELIALNITTHENMGRMMAIGAIDALIWTAQKRLIEGDR